MFVRNIAFLFFFFLEQEYEVQLEIFRNCKIPRSIQYFFLKRRVYSLFRKDGMLILLEPAVNVMINVNLIYCTVLKVWSRFVRQAGRQAFDQIIRV